MNKIDTNLTYICFGYSILSDIKLPELVHNLSLNHKVDITIQKGNLTQLWSGGSNNQFFVVEEKRVMFKVPATGIFLIEKGKKIIYSPDKDADDGLIRLFILGTCMGAILMQRNIFPLHGSAVVIDGKAYGFVGESGAGKSTLASAFINRGFELISDDIMAISYDNSNPYVIPSYPQQKLWKESLKQFGMDSKHYASIYAREEKYSVPINSNFSKEKYSLSGIFELVIGEEDQISLQHIRGLERLRALYRHTYRNFFLKPLGLLDWHFHTSTKIANQMSIYELRRPSSGFTAHSLVTRILETLYEELSS